MRYHLILRAGWHLQLLRRRPNRGGGDSSVAWVGIVAALVLAVLFLARIVPITRKGVLL